MFQRLRDMLRGRRDHIPAPDRMRLLLHVWRSALEREDAPMATRAWAALRDQARASKAVDVLAAMPLVEADRRPAGEWFSASTTLQFAVARFAAGGDPGLSARFVIQDLTAAAASNYQTTRIPEYLAKLRAIRAAADRTGFLDIRDGADGLLRDQERLLIWQAHFDPTAISAEESASIEQLARDHAARISALSATVWRGYEGRA